MKKSGLADSPFFQPPSVQTPAPPLEIVAPENTLPVTPKQKKHERPPRRHDTMQPDHHDTMASRYDGAALAAIRKAVKELGKEAATHRFTEDEKKAIVDLVYSYRRRGIRTSENEVTRIAVNVLIHDYRKNGENSILHKTLIALND